MIKLVHKDYIKPTAQRVYVLVCDGCNWQATILAEMPATDDQTDDMLVTLAGDHNCWGKEDDRVH